MTAPPLPLVSVVIVSWNAKGYLSECLASLRNDVYAGPMEIIVVDNASSDGSAQMVRRDFPDVTLIRNPDNYGFARANNVGIEVCKGDYLALVNSDVHVLPHCITTLVSYCQSHPKVGLIGPFLIGRDGAQQRSCRAAPSIWNTFCRALALDSLMPHSRFFNGYFMGDWNHQNIAPVDILSGCFWLVPRRALNAVGLLDEIFFIYGEDMDWCNRFRDAHWTVVFLPHAQAIHYGGASSANAPIRFFIEKQRADLLYWRKHHSAMEVGLYYLISILHHAVRIIGHSIKASAGRRNSTNAWSKVRRSTSCLLWLLFHNIKSTASSTSHSVPRDLT